MLAERGYGPAAVPSIPAPISLPASLTISAVTSTPIAISPQREEGTTIESESMEVEQDSGSGDGDRGYRIIQPWTNVKNTDRRKISITKEHSDRMDLDIAMDTDMSMGFSPDEEGIREVVEEIL